ncbi:MAG TPA: 2-oxoacid:ferredoxin oxidoreductase subunit beta [bacterium]|nr:2-oxoacid:ferredoxin oxidoreductase subunit beta [bacterium]
MNETAAKPEVFYLDEEISRVRGSGMLSYRSSRLPTWCPGCGFFGIEHALTEAIRELGIKSHELVVVSGIGCTGRYPFFINGYGIHALHGRALPVATGAKIARPELNVAALTGDGDCMGIGIGHLPHACRRNTDIVCVLFDNNIYGLTKGQTSPTTPTRQQTNSHPFGNPDVPLDPVRFVLGAGASFVARGYAGRPRDMQVLFREAFLHKGFSFVHIMSPCVTFDKVNYTYQRLNELIMPLPKRHDFTDLNMAMERALDRELFLGLFYKEERPTFAEQMRSYAERAGGEK